MTGAANTPPTGWAAKWLLMTRPTAIHTGPPIAWPPPKEPAMTTKCPRSFTHEESDYLWRDRNALQISGRAMADELDALRAELATAAGDRDAFAAERDAARRERTAALNDAQRSRAERDAARTDHEEALTQLVTLSEEVTAARMDVRRAMADRDTAADTARDEIAGLRAERDFARSALAEADAAAREARAERDTVIRVLDAVRAVVAIGFGGGE